MPFPTIDKRVARASRARFPSFVASLVAALGLLASCAPLPNRGLRADASEFAQITLHPSAAPSETGFALANATALQRNATIDRVWDTIAEIHYDPAYNGKDIVALRKRTHDEAAAVTSDAAFYRVLKRDVRALDDSHTGVLTPREAEESRARRITQLGLGLDVQDGQVVVARVVPDFPAERAGIRAGMIIEAIDDRVLDEAYFAQAETDVDESAATEPTRLGPDDRRRSARIRAVRSLLVGTIATTRPHRLAIRRSDDTRFSPVLQAVAGDVPTRVVFERLPSGVGLLAFNRFDWASRDDLARSIVAAEGTRGLVIDLRGNPGGEERLFVWLLERFVTQTVDLVRTQSRTGATRLLTAEPGKPTYRGPLAVLIDRGTASAAELTAVALVEQRRALVVGEASCGCVVAIRGEYVLPDGGTLRVSRVGYRSDGGRRMEHEPLLPDIVVAPTLAERRTGDDLALAAAERTLLTNSH